MAYARIFQKLLQNFFVTMGRAPSSAAEWSKLRRQAMELAKKEEGIPSITKNTTLQDLMTGPHMSDGPKGQRIWDFSKDLPTTGILQNRGNIIPFPKGRKTSQAVKGLMRKGDVTVGTAPKTTQGILDAKKDRHILMRDADEDILRIKRENKEAIDRFRRKMNPDEPDKFYAGGLAPLVGEPSYAADFYDDRTPMEEGGPSVDEFRKDKMHNEMMKWLHEYEQYKKHYKWEKKKRSGIEEAAQGGRIGMKVGKIAKGIKTLLKKKKPKIKKDRVATADEIEDYIEILDPTGEAGIVEEGMTIRQLDKMVTEHKAYADASLETATSWQATL